MDEFKKERESIKDKPFKEKLRYFWYYYKLHAAAVVFFLIIVITLIHDVTTYKDIVFDATFINAYATDRNAEFINEFAQLTDIDLKKYQVYLDTNMYFNMTSYDELSIAAAQKFLAMSAAGEIDVVVAGHDVFATYADSGSFQDLRDFLTEEQIEKYKDHFFYFDQTLLDREIDFEAVSNSEFSIPEDTTNRRNPDAMEDPVPVGILLEDSLNDRLIDAGYYTEEQEIIFAIMANSENKIYCQQFLDWLTDYTN